MLIMNSGHSVEDNFIHVECNLL